MFSKWLTIGRVNPDDLQTRQEQFGIMRVVFDQVGCDVESSAQSSLHAKLSVWTNTR